MSRGGVELLFRVFGDRYERASVLITSNLPFGEWNQIFQGERMTAALLDRLTHRWESMKGGKINGSARGIVRRSGCLSCLSHQVSAEPYAWPSTDFALWELDVLDRNCLHRYQIPTVRHRFAI